MTHVVVIGAGALGLSYASALHSAGAKVTLWVRSARTGVYRIRRRGRRAQELRFETTIECVPCDVIFVALHAEHIDEELVRRLDAAACPVVSVSPRASEADVKRWQGLQRFVPATPSPVAAFAGGELEYWVPPLQATSVDSAGKAYPAVVELVALLGRGGIRARFEPDVERRSRATVLAFVPLQRALLLRPELASWRADRALRQRLARGLAAGRTAALRVGSLPLELRLATWLLCRAWVLWWGSLLLPLLVPDLARFLSAHFGHKLEAQTAMFTKDLQNEAASYGLSPDAMRALLLLDQEQPLEEAQRSTPS